MATAPAKVALTKKVLTQYLASDAKRLALGRQIDELERQLKPVKEAISAHIDQVGGSDRTTTHHGFVLSATESLGQPKYKDAFLAIATEQEKADLEANRPTVRKIHVAPEVK